MSDHDLQLTRIDPTWLMTRDHQYLAYSPETGITQDHGMNIPTVRPNDITQGIQRDPESGDAFILVKSVGLLNRGSSNGLSLLRTRSKAQVSTLLLFASSRRVFVRTGGRKPIPIANWLTVGMRTARGRARDGVGT